MIAPSRLVLVGPYPPPWGGISVHIRALRALAERNRVEAEILDVGEAHGTRTGEDRVFDGGSRIRFVAGLAKALRRGDAVHVHTPGNNLKAWMVALAASAPGPLAERRLLTVHSGLAPALLESSSRARSMARATAAGYRRILCTNVGIADSLAACGVPREKLGVVSPFLPSDEASRRAPALAYEVRSRRAPLLACALAPGIQYGEAVLLDALEILAKRHPDLGCLVFGPGTHGDDLRARLAARDGLRSRAATLDGLHSEAAAPDGLRSEAAARDGLRPRRTTPGEVVIPLGELDHDQALGVIELSDVFVRPTLADGDSLSVREALGLGVRVVASDAAPRPPGAATFAAGDPKALADSIEAALRAALPTGRDAREGEASALDAWRSIGLDLEGAIR